MNPTVVIINGKGCVGKDTLIEFLCDSCKYPIRNVSSISPIKELARQIGWRGEKDDRSRNLLSQLKRITTEYNDYPTKCMIEEYKQYSDECITDGINNAVMFVHIREPEEIDKLKRLISNHTRCVTLLIKRDAIDSHTYGNTSDDDVFNYDYDYVYENNWGIDVARDDFVEFFTNEIMTEGD